jgi:ABC-type multidrug transport system ATPase subunit
LYWFAFAFSIAVFYRMSLKQSIVLAIVLFWLAMNFLLVKRQLWQPAALVESFSHGMKQRLVLCAALLHEPRVLIIDEPMVGMDPKGARTLKDLFRSVAKAGTAVFLSTHSISVAEEICHRVGIIQKGRLIASGTMAELYRRSNSIDSSLEDVFLELTQTPIDDTSAKVPRS